MLPQMAQVAQEGPGLDWQGLVAIVAALGTIILGFLQYRRGNKTDQSSRVQQMIDSAMEGQEKLNSGLQADMERCKGECQELRERLHATELSLEETRQELQRTKEVVVQLEERDILRLRLIDDQSHAIEVYQHRLGERRQ